MEQAKLRYEIVYLGLDILFRKEIDLSSQTAIEEHHELIVEFAEACGWKAEDFTFKMITQNYLVN